MVAMVFKVKQVVSLIAKVPQLQLRAPLLYQVLMVLVLRQVPLKILGLLMSQETLKIQITLFMVFM